MPNRVALGTKYSFKKKFIRQRIKYFFFKKIRNNLYQVQTEWYSAQNKFSKKIFAECRISWHSANNNFFLKKIGFGECQIWQHSAKKLKKNL